MKKQIATVATFVVGLYFFLEFVLPPFVGGELDNARMSDPCLVPSDGGYRLYYAGTQSLEKIPEQKVALGLAESRDGETWAKHSAKPVLAHSTFSSKDWRGLSHPAVVREPDGTTTLFYVGHGADAIDRLMRATSRDGLKWKRAGVVLDLSKSEYDRTSIMALAVLREPEQYVLYFSATYRVEDRTIEGVSRATSTDGVAWTLDAGNPVLGIEPEGAWAYQTISGLSVLRDGDGLRLYYAGSKTMSRGGDYFVITLIGTATSDDGIAWQRHPGNPIFGPAVFRNLPAADAVAQFEAMEEKPATEESAPPERFDAMDIAGVSVARRGDGYLLAYGGARARGSSQGQAYRIGFAASDDGITWRPLDEAAALPLGRPPQSTYLTVASVKVSNVFIVIGAMALGLGLVGLAQLHGGKLIKHDKDALYSLSFFVALVFSFVLTAGWLNAKGTTVGNRLFVAMRDGLLVSFGASSMGLLTFYLASASYRSFKLKNAEAGLMMAAAVLVMLGQVPFGQLISSWLREPYQIQNVTTSMAYTIVTPVMRAIRIGAAIGGLVLATRLWLSMERRRD
jgi:hypothetical protein